MTQPLVVCGSACALSETVARLGFEGWQPVDPLPDEPWALAGRRVLHLGSAETPEGLEAALVAAARGAGVVLVAPRDERMLARLVDDLWRLGPVRLLDEGELVDVPLTLDQRRLLELLAQGVSIAEAARLLNLSRRTAHRRLGEARAALGAGSTAQAVALSRDGGARGEPGPAVG